MEWRLSDKPLPQGAGRPFGACRLPYPPRLPRFKTFRNKSNSLYSSTTPMEALWAMVPFGLKGSPATKACNRPGSQPLEREAPGTTRPRPIGKEPGASPFVRRSGAALRPTMRWRNAGASVMYGKRRRPCAALAVRSRAPLAWPQAVTTGVSVTRVSVGPPRGAKHHCSATKSSAGMSSSPAPRRETACASAPSKGPRRRPVDEFLVRSAAPPAPGLRAHPPAQGPEAELNQDGPLTPAARTAG